MALPGHLHFRGCFKKVVVVSIATMNPLPLFSHASWVASPLVGDPDQMPPAPYLRKPFLLNQPLRSAQLTVTALGLYECEINGQRVGDHVFAPGWTDYKIRVFYQTCDVTALLRQGDNVLGAILGDGWYCGRVGWMKRQYYGERPSFLAQLDATLEDGSMLSIGTDASWKTTAGPIRENDFMAGETYDARAELGDWSKPGYDDSSWQQVLPWPDPKIELNAPLGPPVRRIEELRPVSVRALTLGTETSRIFDFGQNFAGWVRLTVEAPAGTIVILRFAEILQPDGSLYTENLRAARVTDSYICKGGGPETWEPRFTFHGFRYAGITGLQPGDKIDLAGIVLHSDISPTGHFACSNPLLNQLQHNIIWGQKSNFLEVPTDCPQRNERLGWTGDAQVFIRTAAFNMDVQSFFHRWLLNARDAQSPKGGIPCVIPSIKAVDVEDGGPAWSDATIICPWTIYLCFADRSILEEHYDSMKLFMEFIAHHRSRGFIRNHPDLKLDGGFAHNGIGDWLALDGSGKTEGGTPRDLIGTAFYAYDAQIMANVAEILGRTDDAKKYRVLHEQIVAAFRRRFVTPEGLIAAGTQTAHVLALHFGLVPDEACATTARELVRDIESRGFHLSTGFVGTPYLLETLEKHGYLDTAYKLLEQETFPSWLFPVKNGATTIWERWDGWTPDKGFQDKGMNSFNHYAYGSVGAWMVQSVAGLDLDPDEPGYRRVIFRPRPGGTIIWAETSLKTPFGLASIRWELKDSELHLDLTVPRDSHATLSLPNGFTAQLPADLPPGAHSFIARRQPSPP